MTDPIWAARARGVLIVLFLTVAGLLGYAVHQHYQVKRLASENDLMVSTLKDTRTQMLALNQKLDALAAPPAAPQPAPVKVRKPRPVHRVVVRHNENDVRFTRLQTQVDSQGRAIESTRQELYSARTELQGGIARNHSELVVLQKKGERNYYEFDLDKSKQFQRTGPIALSLRKANTKHLYADLEIRVEDMQVSQKHVNLFQPVMFYPSSEGRPVELVINSIRHNHIHGYISAPKYTSAELAAEAAGETPGRRQKLEVPR
ncbi:MAG: hypothetical protein ACM3SW_09030 [Actinomycetota bacterium]